MAAKDKQKQADEGEVSSGDEGAGGESSSGAHLAEGETLAVLGGGSSGGGAPDGAEGEPEETTEEDAPVAGHLGAARYVMTGFFLTIIAGSYVLGRSLAALWGRLAEASWFQKNMAVLARVGEEERNEGCIAFGALVALAVGIHAYRRADVRQWTDDVASELSKVTWPDKSEVTNSTIIVIVTSAFATFYLALLDRFWGFVTNLVYGSLVSPRATQTAKARTIGPWPRNGTSSRPTRATRRRSKSRSSSTSSRRRWRIVSERS